MVNTTRFSQKARLSLCVIAVCCLITGSAAQSDDQGKTLGVPLIENSMAGMEDIPFPVRAYYSLDDVSGDLCVDASGNEWHGTVVNPQFEPGVDGNSLVFNGTDSCLILPETLMSDITDCTLSFFTYIESLPEGNDTPLFEFANAAGGYIMFTPHSTQENSFRLVISDPDPLNETIISGTAPLAPGQWHHFAIVADAVDTILYHNGIEAGRCQFTIASLGLNSFTLGANKAKTAYFQGRLDETALFNAALTAEQIKQLSTVVTIATDTPVVAEAGTPGSFYIKRTGSLDEELTLSLLTTGSAQGGIDFDAVPGAVTIPAGESTITLPFIPIADGLTEGDETVDISIQPQGTYFIGNNSHVVLIIDDNETVKFLDTPDRNLDFGPVNVKASASLLVTLSNSGTEPTTLTTFSISNASYTSSLSCPVTLNPGTTLDVPLVFAPLLPGIQSSIVIFSSNAEDNPVLQVNVTGNAVPVPEIAVEPVEITGSAGMSGTITAPLTIINQGGAVLTYTITVDCPDTVNGTPWLTQTGGTGSVSALGAEELTLSMNPVGLSPKTYQATIWISHNDPNKEELAVPVAFTVEPVRLLTTATTELNYGAVNPGLSPTLPIVLTTGGNTPVTVSEVISDNPAFSLQGNLPRTLAAGMTTSFYIIFSPLESGDMTGTIRLISNALDNPVITVNAQGTGNATPRIVLSSPQLSQTVLPTETVTTDITITNTGDATLNYTVDETKTNGSSIDYTWRDMDDIDGPAYVWEDIRSAETNLNMTTWIYSRKVDLPFSFPFYENSYNYVYVSRYGYLCFAQSDAEQDINAPLPSQSAPPNIIAPFWDWIQSDPAGSIYAKTYSNKLIVQYNEVYVGEVYTGRRAVTFQVVIYNNGNIYFYYKYFDNAPQYGEILPDVISHTVGIQNKSKEKGITIAYNEGYVNSGTAIKFTRKNGFLTVTDPGAGTIVPGTSDTIQVQFDGRELSTGTYFSKLIVNHNTDLSPKPLVIPCYMTIPLTSYLEVNEDDIPVDFYKVYTGATRAETVRLYNRGTKNIVISEINSNVEGIAYTGSLPLTIPNKGNVVIELKCAPLISGDKNGEVTIISDADNLAECAIPVHAEMVVPRTIVVDPVEITRVLEPTESITVPITISNTGEEPLTYRASCSSYPFNINESGELAPNASRQIDINFDASHFSAHTITTNFYITHNAPNRSSPLNIPISLTINPYKELNAHMDSYNFNEINTGLTASGDLILVNSGNSPVLVESIDTGVDCLTPSVSFPLTVYAFGTSKVKITFAPESPGIYDTDITIRSNADVNPEITVPLTASARDYAKIEVVTESINQSVTMDEPGFTQIEVRNTGDSDLTLSLSEYTDWLTLDKTGTVITPGTTGFIGVTLDGTNLEAGSYTETIYLRHNDASRPGVVYIPCTMTVLPYRSIHSDKELIDFGAVIPGGQSSVTINLENKGNSPLTISGIATGSAAVAHNQALPLTIAPFTTIPVTFTFTNSAPGSLDTNLEITSNADNYPLLSVPVKALALEGAKIALMPGSVEETVSPGKPAYAEILISNIGDCDLVYTAQESVAWMTLNQTGGTILPGKQMNLEITLADSGLAAGTYSTVLKITHNGINQSSPLSVPVAMTIEPEPLLRSSVDTIEFHAEYLGEQKSTVLYLINDGNAPVTVSSITADLPAISQNQALPLTINAFSSKVVTVTFAPTSTGTFHSTLEIVSNATDNPEISIPISATALEGAKIAVTPSEINGISAAPGQTSYHNLVITNNGDADLTYTLAENADWLSIILLSHGTLTPGTSTTKDIRLYNTELSPGTYSTTISLAHNDVTRPNPLSIPVTFVVELYSALTLNRPDINLGNCQQGVAKTFALTLTNPGNTNLTLSEISSDLEGISCNLPLPITISAFNEENINLTYIPQEPGAFNGTLTFRSNALVNPQQDFSFYGTAAPSPGLETTPASFTETLFENQVVTRYLTLENPGDATLDYSVSVGLQAPEDYQWIDSDAADGPAFVWEDISSTGTVLSISTADDSSSLVNLPFTFTYYDTSYSSVYVGSNGYLTFGAGSSAYSNQALPSLNCPPSLIAPFFDDLYPGAQGTVYAKSDENRLIVQFDNVRLNSLTSSMTFQAVLNKDRTIYFYYKSLTGSVTGATVGIQNQSRDKGFTIAYNTAYLKNNLAVKISPPAKWLALSPVAGSLLPGGIAAIEVTIDTTGLPLGTDLTNILINHNSPYKANPLIVPCTLTVSGIGYLTGETSLLDFGDIPSGGTTSKNFNLINNGNGDTVISDMEFDTPVFSYNGPLPLTVPGNSTLPIAIECTPYQSGIMTGQLTITSDAYDNPLLLIDLSGNAVEAGIVVNPASINAELLPDQTATQALTINNTGAESITYSLGLTGEEAGSSTDYYWIDSDSAGGPAYMWEDISTTGSVLSASASDDGYSTVSLPFAFNYYGVAYTSVYVGSNGYLTLGTGSKTYSNYRLPSSSAPAAIIAPFYDDLNPGSQGTIYSKADGNTLIIQYQSVKLYSSTSSLTFQVVLHNDGTIFFYYKSLTGSVTSATVGIQNQSKDKGLTIAYNTAYLKNNLAVRINNKKVWLSLSESTGTVLPGESKNISVNLNAAGLDSGTYQGVITVNHTAAIPQGPIAIPCTLNVTQ